MGDELDCFLDSQPVKSVACVSYYREQAPEYGVTRPVNGMTGHVPALDAFAPRGHVLELSCGPGIWTEVLLKHGAARVTAVDRSPRCLRVAAWRAQDAGIEDRVSLVESDIFAWRPDRRYDVVFFTALLSWIPPRHFDRFWTLVGDCLEPTGRVFFIGQLPGVNEDTIPEALVPLVERSLNSEDNDRVMVFYEPDELRSRFEKLDWDIAVYPVNGRRFYASGGRATPAHAAATA